MTSSAKSVSLEDADWEFIFKESGTKSPSDAIKSLIEKIKKKL